MKYQRTFKDMTQHYPVVHLLGNWYLLRKYSRQARRFSFWKLVNKNNFAEK